MTAEALRAETVRITGYQGDEIEAYFAAPLDDARHGGVVVIHHMPGYDEATREIVRRFAAHGYLAVCPNLYSRESVGRSFEDTVAAVRAAGGVANERLVGDVAGALDFLRAQSSYNGRVATIGYCSGGRQSVLAACSLALDAAIDCYGGFVVNSPPPTVPVKLQPVVHLVPQLSCPLLGLFGAEDHNPSPSETAELAAALDAAGKTYEFHTYDNAGHAFFAVDRPNYRPEAASDGWQKIWDFLGRHIS
ncbi:MAG TPA: dienelactone hydrolase family protein [Gemmataceae bacterium]|nr:dienelactone hydrolase family protein [Gemmataceae bacterium]